MGIASRHDRVKPTVSHKRIKSLWPKIKGGEKLSNCKNQQHGCEKLLCYRSHPRVLSDVLCLSSKKLSSFKGSGYCFKKKRKKNTVSGTMVVGDVRARYDFTLVVYRMHIDEVDWTIFSTLDEALVNEFTEHFWTIVNFRRKDRRGFLDVSLSIYLSICLSLSI